MLILNAFRSCVRGLKPYNPMSAPYPIPRNFGFATKAANQLDVVRFGAFVVALDAGRSCCFYS